MDPRRTLPSVDRVLAELDGLPHELLVDAARAAVDAARAGIAAGGDAPTETDVIVDAVARVAAARQRLLQPLVNATGVLLHTNLGRAPIGDEALAAVAAVGRGASNLELRLTTGARGSRHEHAGALLARAVGAEAGLVVNNNAAAVLLTLGALARDRDVVVSRGELVEIGGGFRVPDIMAESRCRLVEVGTTNRTRRADYETALTDATALVLKVHASNYRMVGFTEATPIAELAALGPPLMVDAGSGLLDETTPWLPVRPPWLHDEPGIRQAVDAGATVVTFSGDKLLGGPQAGIIVGRADAIGAIARHPLARAMRADKMTLAALQQTALVYLSGDATSIPLWRMATASLDGLRARAERIAAHVDGVEVVDTEAAAGGGSLPGLTIPSVGVAVRPAPAKAAMTVLRRHGVIARIDAGAVICDLRSVDPDDDRVVVAALAADLMRVVATAGHVDHGKSTLVLALTGTDPDRFPEEKARGLTIDLGFAFCTLPSGRAIGFVDVPGHARFVKNMLAGVGAVDVAMLVVAANEGWQPQSEEHLRILDLLDVRHGVVALTKADTVDEVTAAIAALEVEEHLAGTALADFPIVVCDGRTGRGLDDLRAALDAALAGAPAVRDVDRPRLWIDRVFAAKGAGTVVTGTLTGGAITVDDALSAGGRPVRVRGIQQHGAATDRAGPGARVALNLAGVDHEDLTRGDAVVRPGEWSAVDRLDGTLHLLPDAAIDRRRRLTAAVGSGEHHVWCRPLTGGYVRLHFDAPVPVAPGDRIVLRDPGAGLTIAGVEVLDVDPTRRASDAPARLALDPGARVLADGWVPASGLDARTGRAPTDARALVLAAGAEEIGAWFASPEALAAASDALRAAVADHHRDHPTDGGIATADAARAIGLDPERTEAVAARDTQLLVTGGTVRARDHAGAAADSDAGRTLLAAVARAPLTPPAPDDVALARRLVREGALVELGGIYFTPQAVDDARAAIVAALGERGSLTIADARGVLGSTRKYVLPLMNHFDATGVTRRRGDDRVPGPRSGLAAG